MASLVSRDDLAGSLEVGMEGADSDSYDVLNDLAGQIRAIDTEMVQISQVDGLVVIARVEAPPVDGGETL